MSGVSIACMGVNHNRPGVKKVLSVVYYMINKTFDSKKMNDGLVLVTRLTVHARLLSWQDTQYSEVYVAYTQCVLAT